jgi:deoxyhypusine synthase
LHPTCPWANLNLAGYQRAWRLSDEPVKEDEDEDHVSPDVRSQVRCNVFLGYTSNLISSGLRETIKYLVKHKHVAALVTTAGGIEEDFIKCLGKTYLAEFNLDGADLRRRGMNRIGNLIVPNDNYCKFEDWLLPILDTMLAEQKSQGTIWTPSSIIHRLGKEINNEESVYYWAYKVIQSFPTLAVFGILRHQFRRTTSPSSVPRSLMGPWET